MNEHDVEDYLLFSFLQHAVLQVDEQSYLQPMFYYMLKVIDLDYK